MEVRYKLSAVRYKLDTNKRKQKKIRSIIKSKKRIGFANSGYADVCYTISFFRSFKKCKIEKEGL